MNPDRFQRVRYLIGDAAVNQLAEAFVTVIGLGAVGGYAVEALTRCGVGRLRLVDFDRVQPTNFNRQLYALESNLGRLKVDVAAERVMQINPLCQVEALEVFVHEDSMDHILSGPPDLVINAIDALNPKVQLLASVQRRGIPVVSTVRFSQHIVQCAFSERKCSNNTLTHDHKIHNLTHRIQKVALIRLTDFQH